MAAQQAKKQFFKAGRVVAKNELKRFVKLTIDYLGAIEQTPHALPFALHPLLPALEIELLPDAQWIAIAAASRRCNSDELKDAVSRWIPSKFLRFLDAYPKVATDTESLLLCVIGKLFFGDSADATAFLVCVKRLLEQGALYGDTRAFVAASLYLRSRAIVSDGAVAPEKYDACSSMLKTSIACRTTHCAQKLLKHAGPRGVIRAFSARQTRNSDTVLRAGYVIVTGKRRGAFFLTVYKEMDGGED